MKKVDNKALVEHLAKASQKVSAWPQWQQQMFRAKVSNQSTSNHLRKQVKEIS